MRTIISILFVPLLAALTSCEKVIDIDLNSASPKIVIEGGLNDSGPCHIRITKTKNFSENNDFEGISNAFVTITDNMGNRDTLLHTGNGVYEKALTGTPGRTYSLNVNVEGEIFTSVSEMPQPVNIDSLYTINFTGFNDTIKIITADYFDPAGVKNWYRFLLTVNKGAKENIIINNDEFSDGRPSQQSIFYRADGEGLKTGDSVMVEMQCIDKSVYHYFFTLEQTISQSAAAPTNPVSNIKGGALGYFSAHTHNLRSMRIQ
ncbi:MAG TPA: DUF4249 domain-containing protein [Bacteroidia bacterium]|jgi:hypothetical protein